MTHALARVLFLKKAHEFPRALEEIASVLSRFWNLTAEQIRTFSLDEWIEQCRQEEGPLGNNLAALADLFKEQDELYALEMNFAESQRSAVTSLGLYLEAVATPGTIISVDLLNKIEALIEQTRGPRLPTQVSKRLLCYYETRGMLAKAEDALFEWLETADPNAPRIGLDFYERLARKSDAELEQCGLPRAEIEEGRAELLKLSRLP